jgi:hypothetical protein
MLLSRPYRTIVVFHVVGWKTQPFEESEDYVMWVGGQGPLGGVMTLPDEAAQMGYASALDRAHSG